MTSAGPAAPFVPGHTFTLTRSPADTRRPATLWTLACGCGWSKQWGFRTPLLRWHRAHVEAAS